MKRTTTLPLIVFMSLLSSAAMAAGAAPAPLVKAMSGFADYKTFHAQPAELDGVLGAHCKKLRSISDAHGVFNEYDCDPASGLRSAQVTFNRHGNALILLTLHVVFSNDYYADMRTLAEKKLGKPRQMGADRSTWAHTTDKKLNAHGYPMITMTRDRDEKLTSFDVAIEPGT